jgi:hypothetical protein
MPKSSSLPWTPLLLGTSLFLHLVTLGQFFYVQTVNEAELAALTARIGAHDVVLEEHNDEIAKNYVQNYNDSFAVRQDLSDLYASTGEVWTSPYSFTHNDTRTSFSYLEPSEVISNPGDKSPEFSANYQDAYSVFYAVDIADVTVPDVGFEDAQSVCDYYQLGSEAIAVGAHTFCERITDSVSHNILQREAIYVLLEGTTLYTFTFTARTGGTCQYEEEATPACEEKYFVPMDGVIEVLLSSFTTEVL